MDYKYDRVALLIKVNDVIKSCKTKAHIESAYRYYDFVIATICKNENFFTYLSLSDVILSDLRAKAKELGVSNES